MDWQSCEESIVSTHVDMWNAGGPNTVVSGPFLDVLHGRSCTCVLAQILASHRPAHGGAHNDQHHERGNHQEMLDLHAENDARWPIVIDVGMLAGVPYRARRIVARRLSHHRELVANRVHGVIVLEAMRRRDFGSIVVLV